MRKILLICLSCLALVVDAAGQQQANYTSADEIQRDLTFLLLEKNINEVTRTVWIDWNLDGDFNDNWNWSVTASAFGRGR